MQSFGQATKETQIEGPIVTHLLGCNLQNTRRTVKFLCKSFLGSLS